MNSQAILLQTENLTHTYHFSVYRCSVVSDSVSLSAAASQASLSFTISQSLVRLMPIESMMPSNNLILKEINPDSLEGLVLKLKLQYFGHLMWRADSLEKTLMLGKIEGRRRRVQQRRNSWMASPTQWTWVWANYRRWWRTGKPGVRRVWHNWVTQQQ